jgi:hypothetical protein
MTHEPTEDIKKLLQEVNDLIRQVAKNLSTARLLAENEPVGDLVMLSLLDDTLLKSDLWAHLKIISEWLKNTEELYTGQFPEGFPKKEGRYDLTEKPPQFKSRLDIFKQEVEAWESSNLWSAELVFNDPVAVIKKMKKTTEQG